MNGNHAISSAMSVFITELLTLAVYCYFLLSLYKDPACAEYALKHCLTYVNHAIPYTMSGFRTELLTSAVYCYFPHSLLV